MLFPIVIHKDKGSDYGVTVPDLPGCTSAGSTLADAVSQAADAITGHLELLEEEHRETPQPKTIEKHRASEAYKDAYAWQTVEVDFFPANSMRRSA